MKDTSIRAFHVSDILSVVTGKTISNRGYDSVRDILNFMTGRDLTTAEIPAAIEECKPHLIAQFPRLDTPEFQFETGKLTLMLESRIGQAEPNLLILGWVAALLTTGPLRGMGGDTQELVVEPLPSFHAA